MAAFMELDADLRSDPLAVSAAYTPGEWLPHQVARFPTVAVLSLDLTWERQLARTVLNTMCAC